MLKFTCKNVMTARGINEKQRYMRENGLSYHKCYRLLTVDLNSINLYDLEKLCLALNCTPNDLFEWTPDKPEEDTDTTALGGLKTSSRQTNLSKIIKQLPLDKLNEIAKILEQGKK